MSDTATEIYTDHEGKKLAGPCSLSEALELSGQATGSLAVAVSVPDGDYVAVILPHDEQPSKVWVRRINRVSGRSGSILETGRWIDPESEWVPTQWRPG